MTTFNPKITHKIVKEINNMSRRTPWEYLNDLALSDRRIDDDEAWMTERLQNKWPGNYHVQKILSKADGWYDYHIVFDTPADETWFRLQYT